MNYPYFLLTIGEARPKEGERFFKMKLDAMHYYETFAPLPKNHDFPGAVEEARVARLMKKRREIHMASIVGDVAWEYVETGLHYRPRECVVVLSDGEMSWSHEFVVGEIEPSAGSEVIPKIIPRQQREKMIADAQRRNVGDMVFKILCRAFLEVVQSRDPVNGESLNPNS